MNNDKLIAKISKLYQKAQSSEFPEEREAFLDKTYELLEVHQLQLADLVLGEAESPKSVRINSKIILLDSNRYGVKNWKMRVMNAVGKSLGAQTYWLGRDSAYLVGREVNLEVIEYLYNSIINQITNERPRKEQEAREQGDTTHFQTWRKIYYEEASWEVFARIYQELKAQKKAQSVETGTKLTSLVILTDREIGDYLDKNDLAIGGIHRTHNRAKSWSKSASEAGREVGNGVNLDSKGLNQSDNKQLKG